MKPAAPADLKLDAKKKKEEEARKRKRPEEDADEDLQSTARCDALPPLHLRQHGVVLFVRRLPEKSTEMAGQ